MKRAFCIVLIMGWVQTSSAETVPGDINLDGVVDFFDFIIFAENFDKRGEPTPPLNSRLVHLSIVDGSGDQLDTWKETGTATWKISNNHLIISSSTGSFKQFLSSTQFSAIENAMEISVNTVWAGGEADQVYGIIFRSGEKGEYAFLASANGSYAVAKKNFNTGVVVFLQPWTSEPAMRTAYEGTLYEDHAGRNTFKIDIFGNIYWFYINGILVKYFQDREYNYGKEGAVGMFVGGFQEVGFNRFRVLEIRGDRDITPLTKLASGTFQ